MFAFAFVLLSDQMVIFLKSFNVLSSLVHLILTEENLKERTSKTWFLRYFSVHSRMHPEKCSVAVVLLLFHLFSWNDVCITFAVPIKFL